MDSVVFSLLAPLMKLPLGIAKSPTFFYISFYINSVSVAGRPQQLMQNQWSVLHTDWWHGMAKWS